MDPLTAFSLAAGVLQVLDLSLKALGKCREIHKDGSLAQHRQTEEITKSLADTSERLRSSAHSATTVSSEECKDVIELSRKCSATANELLSELRKLQRDPGDSFLKAVKTGVRALGRNKFLTETEDRLQKYQTILNTRILAKLDVHAIQQIEKSQQLHQGVRELAEALAEGRNTVQQLLADQTGIIQGHIDRQFENQAQREAKQRILRGFKKTLFFPEILARRDNIARSHDGTCRWMLKPLEQRSQLDDDPASDDNWESETTEMRVPPESNFVEWLKKGESIYWLNGKPGAGKSTLMKYISTKVPQLHRSGQILSECGTKADFMACSFFFWSLGVSLQKNYVGFVRSLLYQIAEQRDDAISIMMGKNVLSTEDGGEDDTEEFVASHTWTIERLDDALRRFLDKKPASLLFYVFVDGLDEFAGDEDLLLQTIRLLAQTPGTRVCVSSRPEQIFRQGFANSPQLKLQDFNHHDIERASRQQLEVTLAHHFPESPRHTRVLIQDVARKSWGIFLWADLMNKIIRRGAINGDTLQELRKRLDHTPDTIDGLYEDMLSRLDKEYFRDAARYMHMLLIDGDSEFRGGLTLLHFACLEQSTQNHKTSEVVTFDQSTDFDDVCRKLETRILVRCGGLVEIVEHGRPGLRAIETLGIGIRSDDEADEADLNLNGARESMARNLRFVTFIHKTAADFVRQHEKFVKDPKWSLAATLDVTRAKIEGLALTPLVLQQNLFDTYKVKISMNFLRAVMWALPLLETQWPFEEDHQLIRNLAFDRINLTFDIAGYVNTRLDPTLSSRLNSLVPYHNRVGFAAWFGCHDYVIRCVMPGTCSEEVAEEILDCTLAGFKTWSKYYILEAMIIDLLSIIFDFVPQSRSNFWRDCRSDENGYPRWREFINVWLNIVKHSFWECDHDIRLLQKNSQLLTTSKLVLEAILDHNVDVNCLLPVTLNSKCGVRQHNDRMTRIPEPEKQIMVEMRESVLSTLKRDLSSLDPVLAEDVIKLLEVRGAADYKDSFQIGIKEWGTEDGYPRYRLTHAQSEKLMQLPLNRLFGTLFWGQVDKVELQVAGQSSPEAEELLELLCQEAEHLGPETPVESL